MMLDLPISDYLKAYYKEKNVTFTDSQKASIYWNSSLLQCEKVAALQELFHHTEDNVLKEQIREKLDIQAKTEEYFMKQDDNYVYLVVLDDAEAANNVFVSLDNALLYGKENCEENFKISKMILEERLASVTSDEGSLPGGMAGFKKDGTLLFCVCYDSREIEFTLVGAEEPTSFENAYIPLLNPFEYGDIVRIQGDSIPAIVVTPSDEWYETLERTKESGCSFLTYDSNTITVEFLYPDGEFSHDHLNIPDLEKIEEWEDEKEWNLLKAISDLMKGKGQVGTVFKNYNRNKF